MLLEFINKQIIVDEAPLKPQVGIYYLLTRPIFNTPDYNGSPPWFRFYTTRIIAQIMADKVNPVPSRCFRALKNEFSLALLNNKKVFVSLVETGSASGGTMFLFYYLEKYILYTGEFATGTKMLLDQNVVNCIRERCLEDLYIDNTLALTESTNSIETACEKVNIIIRKYRDQKFELHMDALGYEDILLKLMKDYRIKIKLNDVRQRLFELQNYREFLLPNDEDAVITVRVLMKSFTIETADRLFVNNNKIVLKFVPSSSSDLSIREEPYHGIYCIGYGPHPTPSDLHAIIGAIEPNHIHPIGPILFDIECYNGFPSYLANLCKDMERFRTTRDIAGAIDESDALNLSIGASSGIVNSPQHISGNDATGAGSIESFLADTPYGDLFTLSESDIETESMIRSRYRNQATIDEDMVIQSACPEANAATIEQRKNAASKPSVLAKVDKNIADASSRPTASQLGEHFSKLPKRKKITNKILHQAQKAVVYGSKSDSDTSEPAVHSIISSVKGPDAIDLDNSPIVLPNELDIYSDDSSIVLPPELA